ncbi:MAG: hypothetical protein HKN98_16895 [Silicimonas sp.]|nr:hypothetical protein [Silicimonas sp.]NND21653.1 hypothetical protein [Silicimonas sp.]
MRALIRPVIIGQVIRGLVLGLLLTAAILEMAEVVGDVRLFRYQDF